MRRFFDSWYGQRNGNFAWLECLWFSKKSKIVRWSLTSSVDSERGLTNVQNVDMDFGNGTWVMVRMVLSFSASSAMMRLKASVAHEQSWLSSSSLISILSSSSRKIVLSARLGLLSKKNKFQSHLRSKPSSLTKYWWLRLGALSHHQQHCREQPGPHRAYVVSLSGDSQMDLFGRRWGLRAMENVRRRG